ncbi:energy-coupling factor transporter transmembrane component T family protein [Levyella massiliensis]|uniref:energy-coupling factor transporter transmembrane component T family protein n=1 Tax=Levyella massiliensis TaxID=938289 RepID=UPI001C8D1702|nr:energy-coupling factor transporter transmembrane component T [Levyella massiliensis]MBY0585271.1 energy-coupling factor transporter transmembrane protein EcfT [Murdochiella sp. Marseille-P8839]
MIKKSALKKKEEGQLHPFTLFALTILVSFQVFFGNQTVYWAVLVLTLLIALNASTGLFLRQIIVFSVSYGMMYFLAFADLGYVTGIFIGLFALIARFIPIFNIGIVLILTSPSKILACFRKLHMPNTVSVAMIAALRFMDEIGLRLHEIRNGMKIRGFHASLLHPVRTFELYFVPLVYKCLHVSETLVSSIIAKGIEYEGEKTSYYDMRFKFADGISLFAGVALLGVALWTS